MAKYLEAISVSLDTLERAAPRFAAEPTIGEVAIGCAIGYLDFRMPELVWRTTRPQPARLVRRNFRNIGSMLATAPAEARMKINGKPYRTIWPIGDDAVEVIDQTKLPHEFATLTLRSAEEARACDQAR